MDAEQRARELLAEDVAWPRDQANGRLLCSPERPMPKGAAGLWSHSSAVSDGECSEGCCDYYKCGDCGATWRAEVAQ